ncbi:MAG: T9SS type A sorting domain-containing protein [Bacteroidales bacterium]|nr:T9SS type A sorting domain-containing protein [Bacteroidales bacterium]
MRTKHLLLSCVVLVAAGLILFSFQKEEKLRQYYPKHKVEFEKKGFNGAMEWMKFQKANLETGRVDLADIKRAEEQVLALKLRKNPKALDIEWIEMGPDNVGGRTRAILVDKDNPNLVFAGGVAGGLWRSETAGTSWVKVTTDGVFENLAVVSICQTANGDIYFGTGEAAFVGTADLDFTTPGMLGQGIWKSTDGGLNFSRISSTWGTPDAEEAFYEVSRLAADPTNGTKLYAATRKGLRMSTDGGNTWTNPLNFAYGNNRAKDVKVASDGTVAVNVGNRIYISPTGAEGTFNNISPSSSSRMEIAIAPSDPNYIYVQTVASDGSLENVYKSVNKGETWTVIGAGGFGYFNPLGNQGGYDNTIAVFPDNKDKVILGGQYSLWIGTMSGSDYGWEPITMWYLSELNPQYVHADHHALVFHPNYRTASNPDGNQILYVGSDGGVSKSTDGASSFQVMNKKYNVTQFYSVACSPTGWAMGGTQDNGTQLINFQGNTSQNSIEIRGGDGGFCEFSVLNPKVLFATTYYGALGRSDALGAYGTESFYSGKISTKYNIGTSGAASFVTPIDLWESFKDLNSTDSIEYVNRPMLFFLDDPDIDTYYASLTAVYTEVIKDTVIVEGTPYIRIYVVYHSGETIIANSAIGDRKVYYTATETLDLMDTVKIQDYFQAMLAVGMIDNVWVTRRPMDFSGNSNWYPINPTSGDPTYDINMVTNLEWTTDGDILYFSDFSWSSGSKVYRCSNFTDARIYSYTKYDTTISYSLNHVDIVDIDTILLDSTFLGIQIDTLGYLIDSSSVPWDTVYDIEITYLYDYNYDYDTTFQNVYDTIYNAIGSTALFNSLDADDENGNFALDLQLIGSFPGRAVTGLNVDPNNNERLIVTLGNYGNTSYVYYSDNAASTTSSTGNFASVQGDLPQMPVYDGIFIWESGASTLNKVLIGTEYGVYSCENITAGTPVWNDENANGMSNVPVFQIVQQTWPNGWYDYALAQSGVTNSGYIYIGTHGRGIFRTEKFAGPVSSPEPIFSNNNVSQESVKIYPNPVSDVANVSYELTSNGDVNLRVFDLNGRLLKDMKITNKAAGKHTYSFDASNLEAGTYIIKLNNGNKKAVSRFVKY